MALDKLKSSLNPTEPQPPIKRVAPDTPDSNFDAASPENAVLRLETIVPTPRMFGEDDDIVPKLL
eukprot:6445803-Pyramimonas_sp.AAC.1